MTTKTTGAHEGSGASNPKSATPQPSFAPIGSLDRAVLQEKLMQNSGTEGPPQGDDPLF